MIHFLANQFKDRETRSRAFYIEEEGVIRFVGAISAHNGNVTVACSYPPEFKPVTEERRNYYDEVNKADKAARHITRVLQIGDQAVSYS